MTDSGDALAEAARELVGAPYRLHGRDPARGLDCVGVVVASLARIGRTLRVPPRYGLRNRDIAALLAIAERDDLIDGTSPAHPGDILLAVPGPAQHHLLIAIGEAAFVHAHASLRRVVGMPGPLPWPILHHWRLVESD